MIEHELRNVDNRLKYFYIGCFIFAPDPRRILSKIPLKRLVVRQTKPRRLFRINVKEILKNGSNVELRNVWTLNRIFPALTQILRLKLSSYTDQITSLPNRVWNLLKLELRQHIVCLRTHPIIVTLRKQGDKSQPTNELSWKLNLVNGKSNQQRWGWAGLSNQH